MHDYMYIYKTTDIEYIYIYIFFFLWVKPSNHVALGTRAKNILGERENERQKIQRGREERKRERHRVI